MPNAKFKYFWAKKKICLKLNMGLNYALSLLWSLMYMAHKLHYLSSKYMIVHVCASTLYCNYAMPLQLCSYITSDWFIANTLWLDCVTNHSDYSVGFMINWILDKFQPHVFTNFTKLFFFNNFICLNITYYLQYETKLTIIAIQTILITIITTKMGSLPPPSCRFSTDWDHVLK